jgi:hypothetical protein
MAVTVLFAFCSSSPPISGMMIGGCGDTPAQTNMINITFFSSGLRAAPLISYLYFLLQQYGYESLL